MPLKVEAFKPRASPPEIKEKVIRKRIMGARGATLWIPEERSLKDLEY